MSYIKELKITDAFFDKFESRTVIWKRDAREEGSPSVSLSNVADAQEVWGWDLRVPFLILFVGSG